MFKTIATITILFLSCVLSACSNDHLSFKTVKGGVINFKKHQDKLMVINYWSATCLPCIKEIKVLNTFYQQHRHSDAIVIGVNYDDVPPKKLKQLIKHFDIQYPVLVNDPANILAIGHINYLPMTYIFNAHGKKLVSLVGPQRLVQLQNSLAQVKQMG